jgi:hypothetical protein
VHKARPMPLAPPVIEVVAEFGSDSTDHGNTELALVGSVCSWWLSVRRTFADAA